MPEDENNGQRELTNDPRLGCEALHLESGKRGIIQRIWRFDDGTEIIAMGNEQTGLGVDGLAQNFQIL